MINSMKAIKVYCWEKHFEGLIADSRADEVRAIWSGKFLVGIFSSCFIFGTKLSTFCSVAIYIYYTAASDFSAEKIFFLIALLNAVRVSVSIFFPLNCVFASEAYGSAKRIQEFLMLEEQSDSSNQMNEELAVGEIQIEDTNASWNGKEDVLTGISLSVQPQELIVCAGKVGAGKSSLLALVMDELKITSGKSLSNGSISYCPQEAWIFIGSIRENILFGASYNEQKYNEIVKLSALSRDIELFPEGDMTIVGDKGVSLSGGQRARINFARALYREADIYIFDDPFSAVDPKVGKKLAYTIQTYLTNKTRLVITHQEHYLPKYNQLITIADGKITKNEKNEDLENIVLEEPTEDSTISLPKVQPEKSAQEKFKEKNEEGSLSWKMLKGYLSMRYPLFGWLIYFAFESSGMGLVYFSDIWLKIWVSNVEEQTRDLCAQNSANLSIAVNDTRFLPSVENCETVNLMDLPYSDYYKNVYLVISLAIPFVVIAFRTTYLRMCVMTNASLHNKMTQQVIRAPVNFFEDSSGGVVLNRFSKELGQVDDMLPFTSMDAVSIGLSVLGILTVVGFANIFTVLISIPLLFICLYLRRYYIKTARQLKRIEGSLRSPMYDTLNSTFNGLVAVRAFRQHDLSINEFDKRQDRHTGAWMLFLETGRWLGFRLDLILSSYIFIIAICCPLLAKYSGMDPSDVGLTLATLVQILGMMQWGVRQSAETEALLTSVERLMNYTTLETETKKGRVAEKWPSFGEIEFKQLHFSYSGKAADDVLKNISLKIHSGEKIGIVGRTGAGKSSLTTSLFRLRELRDGQIIIDGENTAELKLKCLREGITLIPQEPTIFSDTIRSNLDPNSTRTDAEIWSVLETTQLKGAVDVLEGKLSYELPPGGSTFSIGQRQLMCMARALLSRTKILLIDEATANVDPKTDDIIQAIIRNEFKDCTTLTIAHRINTIIDCDRILVLKNGNIAEFDSPENLLNDDASYFSQIVSETNIADELRQRAKK